MKSHWLDRERLRIYPRAMLLLYLVIGAIWIARSHEGVDPRGRPLGYDFIAFWSASSLARDGQASAAYDPPTLFAEQRRIVPGSDAAYPWQHPPTFLLAVLPLALLPLLWSYAAFVITTLAAYVAVLRRTAPLAGVSLIALAFPGTFLNAFQGQTGFLMVALLGGALLLLESRPITAGVLIGLLAIKPHLALLLPLALACGGYWRAFLSAALGALAFVGLSLAAFGWSPMQAFLDQLPEVGGWVAAGHLPLIKMPTIFAWGRLLGAPTMLAFLLHAAVAIPVALGLAWIWRRGADVELRNAGLACATLLCTPYLFDYDLALLALAIAWFTMHGMRRGWRTGEREVLAACWIMPLLSTTAQTVAIPLAPILMLSLFALILRRARQPPSE